MDNKLKEALELHKNGKINEAEKLYFEILEKEPENADVLHLLGIISAQKEKFSEALIFLKKAVKINPKSQSFQNSLGNIYSKTGDYKKAVSHYKKALKIPR